MPLPDFFIVGAPKCGTTALYQYLSRHPQIFMPVKKEPHYFAQDFQTSGLTAYVQDWKAYLALFDEAQDAACIGEASVFYLYSEDAADKIRQRIPDAKIIAMLRNPVEMIYSLYHQELFAGNEVLSTFEEALAAEAQRKQGIGIPVRSTAKKLFYREIGRYSVQLERYISCFGRENVHVIIYDDFKHDTATAVRDTLHFLEVDTHFDTEYIVYNANKEARITALNRFFFRPPAWYDVMRSAARRIIPQATRNTVNQFIKRLNTSIKSRPALRVATRQQLTLEFQPEVERLSKLLNRDLTHWSHIEHD